MDTRRVWSIIIKISATILVILLMWYITTSFRGMYEDTKKGAARDAAASYINIIEYEIMVEQMYEEHSIPSDGPFSSTDLPNKGTKPTSVRIILKDGKVMSGEMVFNEYVVTFQNGNIINIAKVE